MFQIKERLDIQKKELMLLVLYTEGLRISRTELSWLRMVPTWSIESYLGPIWLGLKISAESETDPTLLS